MELKQFENNLKDFQLRFLANFLSEDKSYVIQESIPVGCVPTAFLIRGVSPDRDPLDRDPLDRDPLDRDPPRRNMRHHTETPTSVERQTPVKTSYLRSVKL